MNDQTGPVYVPPTEEELNQRKELHSESCWQKEMEIGNLISACFNDSKILAIKAIRNILHLGLREAKNLADKYWVDVDVKKISGKDLQDTLHSRAERINEIEDELDARDTEVGELQEKVNAYRRVLNDLLSVK